MMPSQPLSLLQIHVPGVVGLCHAAFLTSTTAVMKGSHSQVHFQIAHDAVTDSESVIELPYATIQL